MRNVRDVMHDVRRVMQGNNSGMHGDKFALQTARGAMLHVRYVIQTTKRSMHASGGLMRADGSIRVTSGVR